MKFVAVLPILAVLSFCGRMRIVVFPGTQQHLSLSQQAHFESNGYAFGASINNIALKENNRSVILTLAIENTGTRGMTVSAIPVLNDPVGQAYPGQAVFFSQIAPGYPFDPERDLSPFRIIPSGSSARDLPLRSGSRGPPRHPTRPPGMWI